MTTAAPGLRLGPYELIARIGAGGMGEVWRATDTRLDRSVAIKICHVQFSERFEREARAVAALNHPNICTLYDVGPDYLVMELVEGPTLAERIAAGPLPLDETLAFARQITEALEAAHEKGIVHRDLKPANVKLTANGNVKVLDFGLAKALDSGITLADPNSSPTLTLSATRAGMILGTAAYMSPEQARGIAADKRADIWAFGVVLYEMLAGKQMFASESVSDTLASVLKTDPDWSALPAGTPPSIRRLLRRCLERDRRRRLHDIADARLEIDEAPSALTEAPAVPAQAHSRIRTLLPWSIAALALIAWLGNTLWRTAAPDSSIQVLLQPPEKAVFTPVSQISGGMAVSPDGRTVAFAATQDSGTLLWVRRLDSLSARPLARTDNAYFPFWSPDNRFLGFFAEGKLRKIEVAGGGPHVICEANGSARGGTWNREGVIVFGGNGNGLQRVSAAGGRPVRISAADQDTADSWPYFLPDGRHYLYLARSTVLEKSAIRVGSLDQKPGVDPGIELLKSESNGVYAPLLGGGIGPGHRGWLLSLRDTTLFAQALNTNGFTLEGEAIPVAEGFGSQGMFAKMSVSGNGVLIYRHQDTESSRLVWMSRDGKSTPINATPGAYTSPRLSPDGNKLAVSVGEPHTGKTDVWQIDLLRGASTRFTFDPASHTFPVWSPDGQKIVSGTPLGGGSSLDVKAANGSGSEDRLMPPSTGGRASYDWSRDGRYILFMRLGEATSADLWIYDLRERKSAAFLETPFVESQGQFSPNGKWVAYSSDASHRFEVYVRSFTGSAQFQISNAGGVQARWRADGKEIYYATRDGKMMAVNVDGGSEAFTYGSPRLLFESRALVGATGSGPQGYLYDVTPDGQRFLIIERGDAGAQPLTLVTNWQAGLKK